MSRAPVRFRIKDTRVYVEPVKKAGPLYDAASGSGRRGRSWITSSAGPNAVMTFALDPLRRRARDAVRQNPIADAAIDALATNIVGTGIKPQFATGDVGLDKDLSQLWLDWTDEADADGRLDWYGQQALAVRGMVEAGEVFGRLRVRRPEDMSTVPLQVQVLEAEYCPVDEFRPSVPGRQVMSGIEFDAVGRRTAYWMYYRHPFDWTVGGGPVDLIPHPIPAREVVHLARQRRPGEIRGEPWLTRALIKLRDWQAYDDSEMMRKKTAAMLAGFVTKPDDGGDYVGEGEPDDLGNAEVIWEPGSLIPLAPGEEITFPNAVDLGGSYEPFIRQTARSVAAAAGVLYEMLTGDYSTVNDRTFRASVNEFRRRAAMWQHHLVVFQFCRPIHRRWIELAVLSGMIRPPRSLANGALYRAKWVPQGWAYIHPVQEVQADKEAIRSGLKSRSAAVSERGEDAAAIDAEQAADNARADALGITYDSDGRTKAAAAVGPASQPRPFDDGPDRADEREEADA